MNVYLSGTLVRTTTTFTNASGAATDPTTITLKYQKAAGPATTVVYPSSPVIKDGVGVYHADLDTTGWAGPNNLKYFIEWIGTGTVQAINVDNWEVTPAEL